MPKTKLFMLTFVALNSVFVFYMSTFFWGNHDWDWVKGTSQLLNVSTGMFEGRYSKFILNVVLFGGHLLPVLNLIMAFTLLAFGTSLLTSYWRLSNTGAKLVTGLFPVLTPFILGWLYFPINILGNFAAIPIIVIGLILAEKPKWQYKTGAVICFLMALGIYPSVVEMIIVCFCFRWLIIPPEKVKDILVAFLPVIISLILFMLLIWILTVNNIIYADNYNLQTIRLNDIFIRIPQTVIIAFKQLWLTIPFVSWPIKLCGLLIICSAIWSTPICPIKVGLWLIAFFATVLSAYLTAIPEDVSFMPRVNFYGLNFFYTGAAALLLNNGRKICYNIGLVVCLLFLFISVNADCEASKVWYLGKQAEENLVERISAQIEETAPQLPIVPILAGEISLRPRYYMDKYNILSPYVLNRSFIVRHIPSGMFNFYSPYPLFYTYSGIETLSADLYAFLQTASKPYPAPQSIFIDKEYAVILLTKEGISAIQAQMPH